MPSPLEIMDKEIGDKVDKFIKKRVEALNELAKSEKELANLGVKFGTLDEKQVPVFEVKENYLPQFTYHLEEYEWEAVYKDGSKLRQYGIDGEHHFGNIEQDRLKEIRYISNFEYPTDNREKRVILTLDWENGTFNLINGRISQKDRGVLSKKTEGKKKLILFRRIRYGQMMGLVNPEGKTVTPFPTNEVYFYKRYYLGFETGSKKVIVTLYPNGEVKICHS